jgi:hypothetical protein
MPVFIRKELFKLLHDQLTAEAEALQASNKS